MTKTISISIADELYERIQSAKGKINVSATSAQAVEQSLNRLSLLGTDDAVEFVRQSKHDYLRKFKEIGSSFARECFEDKEISYGDFVAMERLDEDADILMLPEIFGESDLTFTLNEGMSVGKDRDSQFDDEMFLRGFLEEALAIWKVLQEKL